MFRIIRRDLDYEDKLAV